jgi:hypothetical protein
MRHLCSVLVFRRVTPTSVATNKENYRNSPLRTWTRSATAYDLGIDATWRFLLGADAWGVENSEQPGSAGELSFALSGRRADLRS